MLAPRGSPSRIIGLIAAVAALSNFLEGYSSSYPNTAEFINNSYIARGSVLTVWEFTWYWSLLLNIWFIGYLFGTILTPLFTERYGRKNSLCLANCISLLGTLITIAAIFLEIPELLIFGRIFAAVGSGLSFGSLILFIQETTPTQLRGTCSFLSEVSYIAVSVIGMGMGMDLMLGRNLLALVGFGAIPGILSIFIVLPLRESPKFLLLNRNDRKAAIKSLEFYQGKQPDNQAINEILKESDNCGHKRKEGGGQHNLSLIKALIQILKQPHLRKAFIIGTLSLQIIVGIWPIIYISTDLLEAHFDANASQYSSFAFICANFVASVIGTCSVEKFGRRPMLIWCGIANTLCLCSYILFDRMTSQKSIFFVNPQFKYGCVFSLIAYGITYGAALGPIAFFITSELVPQRFRSLVQSIVFMTNTIINFVFSFITLPLYEIIDVWSFIPLFIIPSIISICYLIKELPETKGREIHEIVEQLKKGTKKKKKSGVIHPAAKGSTATADSSTTISDEENDDIEDFEEGIPDILLATTGHGKNSLIKTAAGSMAIAAAISKVIGGEQQNKNNLTTITPIPEEKDEEEGKE
uniref:Major facilitator superfamily (MFS) profile domain-containing protein n=1 Tax=Meloidogyne enterolobii TaxID=390850 RepID=A0A6V7U6C9_MELEN|nr:unnamed protein product [Meloidogyne enterolobii]